VSPTPSQAAPIKFVITGTSTQTAGSSQTITIRAKDVYGNTVAFYNGTKTLTFSGANTAPDTTTTPKVNDVAFGTGTSITFTAGEATATLKLYNAEAATIAVTGDGLSATGADRLSVTVSPAVVNYITLAYSSGGTSSGNMKAGGAQYAGESDYFVTLTAKDQYANTCSSGANNINGYYDVLWTGANVSPGNNAGATASTAKVGADDGSFACTGFGALCGRTWSNGTVTYKLRLYKVETANLAARLYTNYPTNTNYVDQNATHAVAVALGPIGGGNGAMGAVSVTTQTPTVNTTATAPAVKITDDFGNLATGVSVTFARSAGTGCIAAGGGQTTNTVCINISGTTDGGAVATLGSWTMPTAASDNATDYDERVTVTCGTTPGSIIFYAAPQAAAISSFSLTRDVTSVTASSNYQITITGRDTYNNPLSWGTNLYSGTKSIYFSGPSAAPNGSKPYAPLSEINSTQIFFTNNSSSAVSRTFTAGSATIPVFLLKTGTTALTASTGYSGGPTGIQGTTATDVVAAGTSTTDSVVSLGDTTLQEGDTSTLTLTVKDQFLNPRNDGEITVEVGLGTLTGKTNPEVGSYQFTYTAPTVTTSSVIIGTTFGFDSITAKKSSTNIVGSPIVITVYDSYGTSYGNVCGSAGGVPGGSAGAYYESFADGAGGFYFTIIAYSTPPCCAEISQIECFGTCCTVEACYNGTCNL
jgi:hypothetical protein